MARRRSAREEPADHLDRAIDARGVHVQVGHEAQPVQAGGEDAVGVDRAIEVIRGFFAR